MGKAALVVLLLVTAACGESGSATSTTVAATSSTTAEEALAVDGPVMRYPSTESPSGDLDTLLQGALQLEGNCLLLVQGASTERFPVLGRAGTRWDATSQSVVAVSDRLGWGVEVERMEVRGESGRSGALVVERVGVHRGSVVLGTGAVGLRVVPV